MFMTLAQTCPRYGMLTAFLRAVCNILQLPTKGICQTESMRLRLALQLLDGKKKLTPQGIAPKDAQWDFIQNDDDDGDDDDDDDPMDLFQVQQQIALDGGRFNDSPEASNVIIWNSGFHETQEGYRRLCNPLQSFHIVPLVHVRLSNLLKGTPHHAPEVEATELPSAERPSQPAPWLQRLGCFEHFRTC